jgi:hypothetical protein
MLMKLWMKPSRRNIKNFRGYFTGQIIDLSQFNKPKRKKKRKTPNKPGAPGSAANANKTSVKDSSKASAPRPPATQVFQVPNPKIINTGGGGFNAEVDQVSLKETDLLLLLKLSQQKEVKTKLETLETTR